MGFNHIVDDLINHTYAVGNPPTYAGDIRNTGLIPGLERFPWRRAWQPTPVFLPGESHGQRSLGGCGPKDRKE